LYFQQLTRGNAQQIMFPRYWKFLPALEEMQVLPTAFVGAIRMVAGGTGFGFRLSAFGQEPSSWKIKNQQGRCPN